MPVSYRIDDDLFEMTLVGIYALEELAETVERALADPAFPPNPRFIFDVSRSESLAQRSTDEIRRAVDFFGRHRGRFGGRCVILASTPVQYGLSRMASLLAELESLEFHVTDDRDEGLMWLAQGVALRR